MAPRRIAFAALSLAFVSVSFGLGASVSPTAYSLPPPILHTAAPTNHARSGTSYDWCDCKKGLASLTIWATAAPGKRIVVHANTTGWVQFASPTKTVGWLCKYHHFPPPAATDPLLDCIDLALLCVLPLITTSICSPLTLLRQIALPVQLLSLRLRASVLARSASSHTRKNTLAHAPPLALLTSQATVCRASRRRPFPRPRRGGACASRRRARRGLWVRAGGRPRGASSGTRGRRRRTPRASRSPATTTGTPA